MLAALTVASMPGLDCPSKEAVEARLRDAGVSTRDADVALRFWREEGTQRVSIEMPGAPPRTLAHDAADCASLAAATIALLSVLLDDAPAPASAPPLRAPEATAAPHVLRIEAGALASSGLVASVAAGAEIAVRVKATRVASFVLAADLWPARAHDEAAGSVLVSAATLSFGACAGPMMGRVSIDGCVGAFAGAYSLSASGFPVVHSTTRLLAGGELALRAAFAVTRDFGVFARAGAWAPIHPVDATVRGGATAFSMAAVGPKAALGIEIGFE